MALQELKQAYSLQTSPMHQKIAETCESLGHPIREQYPQWVAWQGKNFHLREEGETEEEAVQKLIQKLTF